MSYKEAFRSLKNKKEGALVCFIVIGDPDYETSLKIAKTIVNAGADILELGLPFSDPIADGPSIQAADIRALNNGMNTDKVFEYIKELRKFTDVPIGLLSYYNLIYQYGILHQPGSGLRFRLCNLFLRLPGSGLPQNGRSAPWP